MRMRGHRHLSSLPAPPSPWQAALPTVSLSDHLATSPVLRLFDPSIPIAKGALGLAGPGRRRHPRHCADDARAFRTARRIACLGVLRIGSMASWGLMLHLNAPPDGFRA